MMIHEEHHYNISGEEVEVEEPDNKWEPEESRKTNNREYVTILLSVLIGLGIMAIVVVNMCK